ncbi:MAG: hypothetical protein IJP43_05545 [Oscillospiraceae bacterium]|nr:hypothetical protein [Oscillospiraceae bacterium]
MKIEILYPELCNLFGDLANAEYLARSCEAELIRTSLSEKPHFIDNDIALVCLGGTTERGQLIARDALKPWLPELLKRADNGGLVLVTGNAVELFGEYIETDGGEKLPMLGVFRTHAKRDMMHRFNSLYLGEFENMKIVGFKSQFSFSYGETGEGLFKTIRGAALNKETSAEGLRRGGLLLTYLLGPLVILNPPFAKWLLGEMGVENPALAFEKEAFAVYETRLKEFSDPARGFEY